VDEVDSVLIDEARVPLIIAGQAAVSSHQYDKLKPAIERLVQAQNNEANRWAAEARKLIDQNNPDKMDEVGRLLFKVKNSMPQNRLLLRALEDPSVRRSVDAAELRLYQDPRKSDLYALKAESYFSIDDKNNSADLSEKGREYMNPNDPDTFVLPDLITRFHEIDQNKNFSKEEKEKAKVQEQQNYDVASERIHNIAQLLRAYCVYEKDRHYIVKEGKVVIVDEASGRAMPGRRWPV
jgi:preprotein translocase subunit SecA